MSFLYRYLIFYMRLSSLEWVNVSTSQKNRAYHFSPIKNPDEAIFCKVQTQSISGSLLFLKYGLPGHLRCQTFTHKGPIPGGLYALILVYSTVWDWVTFWFTFHMFPTQFFNLPLYTASNFSKCVEGKTGCVLEVSKFSIFVFSTLQSCTKSHAFAILHPSSQGRSWILTLLSIPNIYKSPSNKSSYT